MELFCKRQQQQQKGKTKASQPRDRGTDQQRFLTLRFKIIPRAEVHFRSGHDMSNAIAFTSMRAGKDEVANPAYMCFRVSVKRNDEPSKLTSYPV